MDCSPADDYDTDASGAIYFGCQATTVETYADFSDAITIKITDTDNNSNFKTNSYKTQLSVYGECNDSDGSCDSTISLFGQSKSGSASFLDLPPGYYLSTPTFTEDVGPLRYGATTTITGSASGHAQGTVPD